MGTSFFRNIFPETKKIVQLDFQRRGEALENAYYRFSEDLPGVTHQLYIVRIVLSCILVSIIGAALTSIIDFGQNVRLFYTNEFAVDVKFSWGKMPSESVRR